MTFVCKWKSMSSLGYAAFPFVSSGSGSASNSGNTKCGWVVKKCNNVVITFTLNLLLFLLIASPFLCGAGVKCEGVNGYNEPQDQLSLSARSFNKDDGYPTFNVNDLVNLVEMFPEFREYVTQVISNHVKQTQAQPQEQLKLSPVFIKNIYESLQNAGNYPSKNSYSQPPQFNTQNAQMTNSIAAGGSQLDVKPTSRKDWHPYSYNQPQISTSTAAAKLHDTGYGWGGWGYEDYKPKPTHHHHSYGWPSTEYKDPHYHYQVGYNLGKDLSCVFGLLGFKSFKDLTVYSFFSFLKKIKYLTLIGLAFKLGVILSPIALPLLFPIILLAVIAKVLPLLLIIVLLFKLLKNQVKLGGRDDGGGIVTNSILEGTQIHRLWKSIEEANENVIKNETCVEKIVCTISTGNIPEDNANSGRSIVSEVWTQVTEYLPRLFTWMLPSIQWKTASPKWGRQQGKLLNCEKVPCNMSVETGLQPATTDPIEVL